MRAWFEAIRFVKASTIGPVRDAPRREDQIVLPDGTGLHAFVFEPVGRHRGTILFLHGMTVLGNRDPRQLRACQILASIGYRVVSPLIPEIEALRVSGRAVDTVAQLIVETAHRADLGDQRPLGLFSVSYSAGVGLVAAARPEAAPYVASVCAIGSFATGLGWARFLFEDATADEYARMIAWWNLLPGVIGPEPALGDAMHAAAPDMVDTVSPARLPGALARLSERERNLYDRVCSDLEFRRDMGGRILKDVARHAFQDVCPEGAAGALRMPIALLHGAGDNVIPPGESAILHKALQQHGAASRLIITTLLTHGDVQLTPRAILESFEVLRVFAHFFGAIPAPTSPRVAP